MPATTHAARSEAPLARVIARGVAARLRPGALGAWTLGFALVAYLGLEGGGYDVVVRSQVGIALWWIVGLGAATGVLGGRRVGAPLAAALALTAALAAWTLLSATWSESGEDAVGEAARTITVLGAFALAAAGVRARHRGALLNGIVGGIVLVAGIACLSRLHPAWFDNQTAEFLAGARERLSYGLNYWNALGGFAAVGIPLALAVAQRGRTIAGRALGLAAVPVLALTILFTLSRGGMLAAGVGLAVALALAPQRLRWLGNAALAAIGSAILIAGALQRDELRDGLGNAVARDQGDELLLIVLAVVAGVALVRAGAALADRAGLLDELPMPRPRLPRPSLRRRHVAALAAGVAVVGAIAIDAPGRVADGWQTFTAPGPGEQSAQIEGGVDRLGSLWSNGRYQLWSSAYEAFAARPLAGIGAGSFETWWARDPAFEGKIQNAHSLFMETLGELGLVGMALLAGLFALVLGVGAARALSGGAARAGGAIGAAPAARRRWRAALTAVGTRGERGRIAGATGACAAFAVTAGIDWTWQVTVVPVAFALAAVVALGPPRTMPARRPRLQRGLLVVGAALAIAALVPTVGANVQLRQSQDAAAAGELAPALAHARSAADAQPYPFTPVLQRAMVLERAGRLAAAAVAARDAARREPTNWRAPFVLARIEARRDRPRAAVAAFRRARALNKTYRFLR